MTPPPIATDVDLVFQRVLPLLQPAHAIHQGLHSCSLLDLTPPRNNVFNIFVLYLVMTAPVWRHNTHAVCQHGLGTVKSVAKGV